MEWRDPRIPPLPRQRHREAVPSQSTRAAPWRHRHHGRRRHGSRLRQSRVARGAGLQLLGGFVKAWIVAVGSELLTPFRIDTNSLTITERLNAIGCEVRLKFVVGDDVGELAALFARGIGSVDVIIVTGGLGPTEDDITRDALIRAL